MRIFKIIGWTLLFLVLIIVVTLAVWFKSDIPLEKNKERYITSASSFMEIEDANLHIKRTGSGAPILLIHGSFSSLHTWNIWQQELSKHYECISVDLPGHGLTGPNKNEIYTTDYYADLLWTLADSLQLPEISIAGNSMGGQVAYQMALKRPETTTNLILIDPSGATERRTKTDTKGQELTIFDLLSNPLAKKMILNFTPKFLFEMSIKQVYYEQENIENGTLDRYYHFMLQEGNRKATMDRLSQTSPSHFEDLANLTVPTLILWGKHDQWIPVSNAMMFQQKISASELVVYENAGHVPMEEIPLESVSTALKFLRGNP